MLIRKALLVLLLAAGLAAPMARAETPETLIRGLGNEVIRILTSRDMDARTREQEFTRLLDTGFDLQAISQFTLGRYWRMASEAQRAEYRQLLQDFVIKGYASRLTQYGGQTLSIHGTRPDGERQFLVLSVIEQPKGPPIRVDWRVREGDGALKIVDVIIEGVSMALTHRSEFNAVVQNAGGNIDALLDALRKRVASAMAR